MAGEDQWVTMKEASAILKSGGVNASPSKISRLAAIKAIEVREDIVDRRMKLVNVSEISRLLSRR